jgi:WD40 repeat protein
VVARSHDGAERWRWRGTAPITAVDATDAWVAAGDVEGRVLLFTPDGGLVARITGHTRRVSSVVLRGARLYSASWDGLARVWSLDDARMDGAAWVDRATRTWGLSLAEALVAADSAGAED